jgi:hypothetical protein
MLRIPISGEFSKTEGVALNPRDSGMRSHVPRRLTSAGRPLTYILPAV